MDKVSEQFYSTPRRLAPVAIFLALLLIYLSAPVMPVSDSKWTVLESISLLRRGDLDLNEYPLHLKLLNYHGTVENNGRIYDYFPAGVVFLAAPFVWLLSRIYGYGYLESNPFLTELVVASTLTALAVAFFFCAIRRKLSMSLSIAATLIFSLGCASISTASRALWQQTGMTFLICWSIYLIARLESGDIRLHGIAAIGFLLAAGLAVRPLSIVWSAPTAIYILYRLHNNWRKALAFLIPAAITTALFFIANKALYDQWLPPYYDSARVFNFEHFGEALAANLVSPARGIFVWSPIFLASWAGAALTVSRRGIDSYYPAAGAIVVLHLFVISSFPHWWGGHSIGPRLQTELSPLYAWLLVPFLHWIESSKSRWVTLLAVVAGAVSIAIHVRAAFVADVNLWNARPDINAHPDRIWSWRSAQFLAGEGAPRYLFRQQ